MTEAKPDLIAAGLTHFDQVCPALAVAGRNWASGSHYRLRPIRVDQVKPALARIVICQQVSTRAADAIWGRCQKLLAKNWQLIDPAEAKNLGLSRPKLKSLQAISRALELGQLDCQQLLTGDLEAAGRRLQSVWGLAGWSWEMFQIFGRGEPDVFSYSDLVLKRQARLFFSQIKGSVISDRQLVNEIERLRPYRSLAALIFWNHQADWLKLN